MTLSDYSVGRDNNFNALRVIAALSVLVTHSFALATGSPATEPLRGEIGMTMGAIAVDVFFVTSGFLVTSSLLGSRSLLEFACARILRIYPALIVMVSMTVFALGALFTSLPIPSYFSSPQTYLYLVKCSTLILNIEYQLPGVFDSNPFKSGVNGSLWTMPYEIRMYAMIAILWLALRMNGERRLFAFKLIVVTSTLLAGGGLVYMHLDQQPESNFLRLFFMFFAGASFYVLRERVRMSHWAFVVLLCGLALSFGDKTLFFIWYAPSLGYLVLYLAYIPSGFIRSYNRIGDYSYGIYIYAFPVQQTVAALVPNVSIHEMILLAGGLTTLMAMLSWHLIEKRFLALKPTCAARADRMFSRDRNSL